MMVVYQGRCTPWHCCAGGQRLPGLTCSGAGGCRCRLRQKVPCSRRKNGLCGQLLCTATAALAPFRSAASRVAVGAFKAGFVEEELNTYGGGGSGGVPQRGRLFKLDFLSAKFWVIFLGCVGLRAKRPLYKQSLLQRCHQRGPPLSVVGHTAVPRIKRGRDPHGAHRLQDARSDRQRRPWPKARWSGPARDSSCGSCLCLRVRFSAPVACVPAVLHRVGAGDARHGRRNKFRRKSRRTDGGTRHRLIHRHRHGQSPAPIHAWAPPQA